MNAALLAVLALSLLQETPEDLVLRLSDDLIEVRERASDKLRRIGEPAREALLKAAASGDPALRSRAESILKHLDVYRDLRQWLAPPLRISISGEWTLERAIRELERQSGQKIAADTWPEGKFRIDLKEIPFWNALEAVCAASGARTPVATESGPKLEGPTYVKLPSWTHDALTLRVARITREREFKVRGREEANYLMIDLALGWERCIVPVRAFIDVAIATDDQGLDLRKGFADYEDSVCSGLATSAADPPPRFCEEFHLATRDPPNDKAKVIPMLAGKVVLWVRASPDYIEFAIPKEEEEVRETLRILDPGLGPVQEKKLTVSGVSRNEKSLCAELTVEDVDRRMLKWNWDLCYLRDTKDRRYPGHFDMWEVRSNYVLYFPDLPPDAVPARIVLRIPRRVVQVEIPFTLKDIPVK